VNYLQVLYKKLVNEKAKGGIGVKVRYRKELDAISAYVPGKPCGRSAAGIRAGAGYLN